MLNSRDETTSVIGDALYPLVFRYVNNSYFFIFFITVKRTSLRFSLKRSVVNLRRRDRCAPFSSRSLSTAAILPSLSAFLARRGEKEGANPAQLILKVFDELIEME